jgi:hypothetical protein
MFGKKKYNVQQGFAALWSKTTLPCVKTTGPKEIEDKPAPSVSAMGSRDLLLQPVTHADAENLQQTTSVTVCVGESWPVTHADPVDLQQTTSVVVCVGESCQEVTVDVAAVTAEQMTTSMMKSTAAKVEMASCKHTTRIVAAVQRDASWGTQAEVAEWVVALLQTRVTNSVWVVSAKAVLLARILLRHGGAAIDAELFKHRGMFSTERIQHFKVDGKHRGLVLFLAQTANAMAEVHQQIPAEIINKIRENVGAKMAHDGDGTTLDPTAPGDVPKNVTTDIVTNAATAMVGYLDVLLSGRDAVLAGDYGNIVTRLMLCNVVSDFKLMFVVTWRCLESVVNLRGVEQLANVCFDTWTALYERFDAITNQLGPFFAAIRALGVEGFTLKEVPDIEPLPQGFLRRLVEQRRDQDATKPTQSLQAFLQQAEDKKRLSTESSAASSEGSAMQPAISQSNEVSSDTSRGNTDRFSASLAGFGPSSTPQQYNPAGPGFDDDDDDDDDDTSDQFDSNDFDAAFDFSQRAAAAAANSIGGGSSSRHSAFDEEEAKTGHARTAEQFTINRSEVLGRGAFGTVYKAFDNEEGRPVAVKELKLDLSEGETSDEKVKEITDEFDTLVRLQHPNIVSVLQMSVDDKRTTGRIFMEWVPGGSIQSVMKLTKRGFKEGVVSRYARQLLAGLAYLHRMQILHRDIKPANMLLSGSGDLKLSDFGTSRIMDLATTMKTETVVGTVPYLAPECFSGNYSQGSDVWAIGCSVLELLTGQMPWADRNVRDNVAMIFLIGSAQPPNHHPTIPTGVISTPLSTTSSGSGGPASSRSGASGGKSPLSDAGSVSPPPAAAAKPPAEISAPARDFLMQCFAHQARDRPSAEALLNHPFLQQ